MLQQLASETECAIGDRKLVIGDGRDRAKRGVSRRMRVMVSDKWVAVKS